MNPLTPIERILTEVLEWLHASIGLPWAWSIIVLTLMVRMVILPLTIKQIRSMQRLQVHAPELKAIQQKYKSDRQRMNEEVMKFYRENNVNPLASCLPIVLQLPVFFALFFVLRDFEKEVFPNYPDSDLGWLGIVPNITWNINEHWSGWLLLVVYVASQVASTYFMSTTMDPRQRYIFFALPFLFVFFVINFPIGLMLYWSTTNLWTVGQGLITRRLVPKPQPPPKRTSRTPPKAPPAGDGGTQATAGDEAAAVSSASGAGRRRRARGRDDDRAGARGVGRDGRRERG
jgi:YidC/Oxa1 family membrane protein insertase